MRSTSPPAAGPTGAAGAPSGRNRRTGAGREAVGASSSTTWALIPPKPNALTPARRGCGPRSHGSAALTGRIRVRARSGCGSWRCSVGGSTPSYTASAALISPAMPEACMVCPSIDFTEPKPIPRPPAGPGGPNTWARVSSSAASPTGVPVPCASSSPSAPGARGSSPASRQARSRACTWPATSGLIRLAARPSPATPVPRITAYTRSPSRSASASRFSSTTPVPSDSRVPSARRSKGRIRSLGLSARSCVNTLHSVAM